MNKSGEQLSNTVHYQTTIGIVRTTLQRYENFAEITRNDIIAQYCRSRIWGGGAAIFQTFNNNVSSGISRDKLPTQFDIIDRVGGGL